MAVGIQISLWFQFEIPPEAEMHEWALCPWSMAIYNFIVSILNLHLHYGKKLLEL